MSDYRQQSDQTRPARRPRRLTSRASRSEVEVAAGGGGAGHRVPLRGAGRLGRTQRLAGVPGAALPGLPAPCQKATGEADSTLRRLNLSLQLLASGVTTRIVALGVVTSLMAGGVGRLQAWPLWAIVLAMVVPAMPVFASPAAHLRRHDGALALFYLLVLAQTGHVLEHLTQVTQLHVLHHTGEEAHGVFGALDVEWVHFIWNAAILLAVVFVLRHYRRNAGLWFALAFAGWHQVEHTYIMAVYLQTAEMGTPGLLSAGGALGGGLPLRRPDLHFLYNVLETTPLVLAFLHQVGKLSGGRQAAVVAESRNPDQPRRCLLGDPHGIDSGTG